MDNLQKIAYCLDAAGTLLTPDLNHLIYANDGTLTEESWDPATGETVKIEEVGDGVKLNAPAAYVWYSNSAGEPGDQEDEDEGLGNDERIVISVTPEDKLILFKYDYEEDDIWKSYEAGNIQNVTVHPETGLAAALNSDGIYLFFVNPAGELQAVVDRGGDDWTPIAPFDAKPRLGTPLTATVTDEGSSLFYFGVDDKLHYLHRPRDSGVWTDSTIDNILVETPVTRFRASFENGRIEAYVLTEGKLFQLSETGEPVEVGTVEGRQLKKHNNAQNIRWVSRGCRPYFYRVHYVVIYHCFRPRVRGWCW